MSLLLSLASRDNKHMTRNNVMLRAVLFSCDSARQYCVSAVFYKPRLVIKSHGRQLTNKLETRNLTVKPLEQIWRSNIHRQFNLTRPLHLLNMGTDKLHNGSSCDNCYNAIVVFNGGNIIVNWTPNNKSQVYLKSEMKNIQACKKWLCKFFPSSGKIWAKFYAVS